MVSAVGSCQSGFGVEWTWDDGGQWDEMWVRKTQVGIEIHPIGLCDGYHGKDGNVDLVDLVKS